ncbi:unnamed protein product [Polarella glacialis]|uniref:Uncharacterized protein n=1 Tax=Polarella glacialis TaxID=89957 RepID=A0A813EWF9_POLGL|nr:unnamed protein product [Polarella glacialis]
MAIECFGAISVASAFRGPTSPRIGLLSSPSQAGDAVWEQSGRHSRALHGSEGNTVLFCLAATMTAATQRRRPSWLTAPIGFLGRRRSQNSRGTKRPASVRQAARWSEQACGSGLGLNDEATFAKRVNYSTRPEGFCVVLAETVMASELQEGRGRVHYGEIRIESDACDFAGGLEIGVTALSPEQVSGMSSQVTRSLNWAELPQTLVLRDDGQLRVKGRSYPPGAFDEGCMTMKGFRTVQLEYKDRLGILVLEKPGALVAYVNDEPIGRLELGDAIKDAGIPLDGELRIIVDVVSKACEVEILEVQVPKL